MLRFEPRTQQATLVGAEEFMPGGGKWEGGVLAAVAAAALAGEAIPGAVWALPPALLTAVRAALLRHAPLLGGAEAERAAGRRRRPACHAAARRGCGWGGARPTARRSRTAGEGAAPRCCG